jgi:hypothetical protein
LESQWKKEDERKKEEFDKQEEKYNQKLDEIKKRKREIELGKLIEKDIGNETEEVKSKLDNGGKEDTRENSNEAGTSAQSEVKAKELENVKSNLNALHQTKSQIIWLLKQVITAEKRIKDSSRK